MYVVDDVFGLGEGKGEAVWVGWGGVEGFGGEGGWV